MQDRFHRQKAFCKIMAFIIEKKNPKMLPTFLVKIVGIFENVYKKWEKKR